MEYTTLGRTGVEVSRLCLGTAMFGSWTDTVHEEAARVVHAALDAGINFVDTADQYSTGESETIVGKALAGGRRDDVVLATKFHFPQGPDRNQRGNSRRWIMKAVEGSLERLQTDWIDLYQVHWPDPGVEVEETLAALTDLVRAGKVRYIGLSNFPAHQIVEAMWASERRQLERIVSVQPPYSMLVRKAEAEILPVCERYGLAVIPWGPIAGGWLTGRYRQGADAPTGFRVGAQPHRYDAAHPENAAKLAATEALAQLAGEVGTPLIELALAFVLQHPAVTAAIAGVRTVEHLESQLPAVDVRLDAEVLDRIDAIVAPGTTTNSGDDGWSSPALSEPALRRQ
jgi:aryl-alcohol dehydrogenase-like predicted oxidoreductase